MHDFIVKRAVDFLPDLNLHSLRAPDKNARHFYSCFQACILPPNFLTGSLKVPLNCVAEAAGSRQAPPAQ